MASSLYQTKEIISREKFEKIRKKLCEVLKPDDIVIMDNLAVHKIEKIEELITNTGAILKYLPPYSPDFNPIELFWAKVKSYLRKQKIRKKELLKEGIESALALSNDNDSLGYFKACGY